MKIQSTPQIQVSSLEKEESGEDNGVEELYSQKGVDFLHESSANVDVRKRRVDRWASQKVQTLLRLVQSFAVSCATRGSARLIPATIHIHTPLQLFLQN